MSHNAESTNPAATAFKPPSLAFVKALLTPQRLYHRPLFFGLEHLRRDRPTLYVGNHTIFGVLDSPLILERIYEETGHLPRAMADRSHFTVAGWRDMLTRFGAVEGSRDVCSAIMREGHSVLVFPGGGREVAKRKDEEFSLVWKRRVGFARMAVEHGFPITPFASVGPERCYSIHLDANELRALPLWKRLEHTVLGEKARGGDLLMPIATGLLGSPLPRPERFYIGFGEPIETRDLAQNVNDEEVLFALRRRVRESVERLIAGLCEVREQAESRNLPVPTRAS